MKHLKIVAAGWAGYTGQIGLVEFVDGVSTDPVPQRLADQVSANIECVELEDDGSETQANPAARLIGGATISAVALVELERASDEELAAEAKREAEKAKRPPVERLYTQKELEAIADKDGIKALRPIGKSWNVKGRSIPELIRDILAAQGEFSKTVAAAEAAEAAQKEADAEKARKAAEDHEAEVSANGRDLSAEDESEEEPAPAAADNAGDDASEDEVGFEDDADSAADEASTEKPQADESKGNPEFSGEGDTIKSTEA
jgi:hypothetical protein